MSAICYVAVKNLEAKCTLPKSQVLEIGCGTGNYISAIVSVTLAYLKMSFDKPLHSLRAGSGPKSHCDCRNDITKKRWECAH